MVDIVDEAYGSNEGWANIVVGHYEADKPLIIDIDQWFHWPDERDAANDFIAEHNETDVYFCTSLSTEKRRGKSFASVGNMVYVDADLCEPDKFRVKPTFSVQTSPGHYQCYWLLDGGATAAELAEVSHRICIAHADDGCDPSGWITAKLMRVPGTTHTKDPENPHTVKEVDQTGQMFSLEDLQAAYADVEIPLTVTITDRSIPDDLPRLIDVVARISNDDDLYDLYLHEPTESDDRSKLRWRLSLDMFRLGFKAEEVYVAVASTKYNKYVDNHRPPEDLWAEVLKAEATYEQEIVPPADETNMVTEEQIVFVSEEERQNIQPCFIDDYEAWVATRSPLSAHKYNRSLAFMLLSNVYGGWAYILPQFGPMYLNLWTLMLGDTTATRKSTARDLMLAVLSAWEARLGEGKHIEIGSDFTSEGLNAALADRDGEVSFIHRDEMQGFFQEMFTKNYMAGAVESMTDLYGGKVKKTMRASAKNSQQKNVRTVFNFLGIGIETETASVLTAKNFKSGFLPRALWCVADPPEWQPEHEHVIQLDPDNHAGAVDNDPAVTEFCNQFSKGRRKWDQGHGKAQPILMTEEALARWNQWKVDSKAVVRGKDNENLLEPARDRMSYSIWKAAALLAMHERSDKIELRHILYVLRESEVWFKDLIRMANAVAASDFEGRVNEVEDFIAKSKKGRPTAEIYRKFSSYRKGEVDEFIANLRSQGRIIVSPDGGYMVNK